MFHHYCCYLVYILPVNYVGQQVVVPQLVVRLHLLVVDGEGSSIDTASLLMFKNYPSEQLRTNLSIYIFMLRMSPELSRENFKDGLSHPPPLGEGGKSEVVRMHFSQT